MLSWGRGGGRSEQWYLPSEAPVPRDGALLSWGWLNACLQREAVNEPLVLLCFACVALVYL